MDLPLPQPSTQPLPSPFTGVDWYVVAYSAFMATLIGTLMTMRQRNSQAARGLPLQPWTRLIPEVALGTLSGTLAAIGIPPFAPWLNTLSGLTLLAGFFSLLGSKIFDFVEKRGFSFLLEYLATKAAGPLAALAAAAAEKEAVANTPEGGEPHDETHFAAPQEPPAGESAGAADAGTVGPPEEYR